MVDEDKITPKVCEIQLGVGDVHPVTIEDASGHQPVGCGGREATRPTNPSGWAASTPSDTRRGATTDHPLNTIVTSLQ